MSRPARAVQGRLAPPPGCGLIPSRCAARTATGPKGPDYASEALRLRSLPLFIGLPFSMASFGNQAVNRLNLHSAIQAFAQNAGGVFVFVYLLKAGVPAALVFCVVAGMNAPRFVLRPLVLPLARGSGLKALLTGTVLEARSIPASGRARAGEPLIAVIFGGSVGSVLYWTWYHAFFSASGDAEHRGGQVGAREAMSAVSIARLWPAPGRW